MFRRYTMTSLLAGAVLSLATMPAAAVTVNSAQLGSLDGTLGYTPSTSGWAHSTNDTSGSYLGAISGRAQVFLLSLRLPELPTGMQVASAQLDVYAREVNAPNFNLDLWGLGYRADPNIIRGDSSPMTGDYPDIDGDGVPGGTNIVPFSDTTDLGAAYGIPSRVKLMDDMLTASTTVSDTTPISTTGNALAQFIQSLYNHGAVGGESGDFVVLRLTPDSGVNVTQTKRYRLYVAESGLPTAIPTLTIVFGPAAHPGDANGDGIVNLADLQILGDNWQSTTAGWSEADFTGDNIVNLADLQIIGDNWGYGTGGDAGFDQALESVAIPEPAGLLVLGLGNLLILCRR